MTDWPVPTALVERMRAEPRTAAWVDGLAETAQVLTAEWGLRPDGTPWSGWQSVVWPVRDADGPWVLKVGNSATARRGTGTARSGCTATTTIARRCCSNGWTATAA